MLFVTDFADQAVMSPMIVVVFVGLCSLGWWRGALSWLGATCGTSAVILCLKAGFMVLTAQYGSDYEISPSGHVASACVVYGGLAVLLLRGVLPGFVIAAVPAACILLIGYTRVELGTHTLMEVASGAVVGLAGVATLAITVGERPRLATWPLTLGGVVTVLALHGSHLPAEQAIQAISTRW